MAADELMKEADKTKARVEVGGAMEWKKQPKKLNKTFADNTVLQVTSSNKRASSRSKKE